MDLKKRLGIISKIVDEKPGLGKTAIMKHLFLLQEVYKVPLGYDFEIYTYGPYSSEVMEDIDYAKQLDIVLVEREIFSSGFIGYRISPTEKLKSMVENEKTIIEESSESINNVLSVFGSKTARELELLTTIVYLYSAYKANGWSVDEVISNVQDIKPHFDEATIRTEYEMLKKMGILARVA